MTRCLKKKHDSSQVVHPMENNSTAVNQDKCHTNSKRFLLKNGIHLQKTTEFFSYISVTCFSFPGKSQGSIRYLRQKWHRLPPLVNQRQEQK